MDFRDATPADAPLIASLHAQSWRHAYAHFMTADWLASDIEAERLAVWTPKLATPRPGQRVIIAQRGGEAIGFTCVIGGADPRWGTLVDNLHALKSARGSGVGTALLDQAARWAMTDWANVPIHLWCFTDNVAARGFYAARGGEEVETCDKPAHDGHKRSEKRIAWRDPGTLISPPANGRGNK